MSNINEIKTEIEIKQEDIFREIRIINSFEEYNSYFELEKDKFDKYKNEKEIKEKCKIIINNKMIPFSYFYKFKKKGKYIIKYEFNDNIAKVNCFLANAKI